MPLTAIPAHVYEELSKTLLRLSGEEVARFDLLFRDLVEAVRVGKLGEVNRDKHRQSLGLKRILPDPTIIPLDNVVLPARTVSVSERIKAGDYKAGVNPDITDDLIKITLDAGPAPLVLAGFGVEVGSEEVEAWAKAHGCAVAYPEDGLAVGATPEHQYLPLEASIVVLGGPPAVLDGYRRVLCLSRWHDERILHLRCCGFRWPDRCRFLLRKAS